MVSTGSTVVNGWEVVNAYSELVDPVDQAERFKQQAEAVAHGDQKPWRWTTFPSVHGIRYASNFRLGHGIDRIVALLTNASTLRDVILFPLMRPE